MSHFRLKYAKFDSRRLSVRPSVSWMEFDPIGSATIFVNQKRAPLYITNLRIACAVFVVVACACPDVFGDRQRRWSRHRSAVSPPGVVPASDHSP